MLLNEEQRAAVEYVDGPQVIVAGPGSGKTRAIISRIGHLVNDLNVPPERILAITYTKKAAGEMQDRLAETFPYQSHQFTVSTFHALCSQLVEEFGSEVGFRPGMRVLDTAGSWVLARRHIEELGLRHYMSLSDPFGRLFDLLAHISRAKDEVVSPTDYATYASRLRSDFETRSDGLPAEEAEIELESVEKAEEVARFYACYQELMRRGNCIDFGDQIFTALTILVERPAVRKLVQDRWDHVLVDEFQDTNVAQIEILKLLVGPQCRVCVVGDPDQSIYRFRGASFASFVRFDESWPDREQFAFTTNYRSTANILEVAGRLISYNQDRYAAEKPVRANSGPGAAVAVVRAPSFAAEAEAAALEILRVLGDLPENERRFADFAILYRAHKHREEFAAALERHGIPFRIQAGDGFRSKEEILDISALVRVVGGRADGPSVFRVLSMDEWGLPSAAVRTLTNWAFHRKIDLWHALALVGECEEMPQEHRSALAAVRESLSALEAMAAAGPGSEVVRHIYESTGILKRYLHDDTPDSRQRAANLAKYLAIAQEFEKSSKETSLSSFAEYRDYLAEANDDEEEAEVEDTRDAVQLMTVHAAKGLEWPYVFVVCLSSRRFPSSRKNDAIPFPAALAREAPPQGDHHISEERRLAYVGFTRAQKRLYLTCVDTKGTRACTFIQEAGDGDCVEHRQVDEVDFDRSIEAASDLYRLERDARRTISRMVDEPDDAARMPDTARLVRFIRDIRLSADRDWAARLAEFDSDFARIVDPALADRIRQVLSDRALAASLPQAAPSQSLSLSYSQVTQYETCPFGYKLAYVLRIPGSPKGALTFGTVMHRAVQRFYEQVRIGKEPTLEELQSFLEESWVSDGYVLRQQETGYKREGLSALERLHRRQRMSPAVPIHLEWRFRMPLGEHFLTGIVDRIDPAGEGRCEIIDYKTGKAKDQKEVDKDAQLALYALAVKECLGLTPTRLGLYFLSSDEIIYTTRTDEQIQEARQRVLAVAEAIGARRFDPTPGFRCRSCDYAGICPALEE